MNTQRDPHECPRCGDYRWQYKGIAVDTYDLACSNCNLHLGYSLHYNKMPAAGLEEFNLVKQGIIMAAYQGEKPK